MREIDMSTPCYEVLIVDSKVLHTNRRKAQLTVSRCRLLQGMTYNFAKRASAAFNVSSFLAKQKRTTR